jgi:hypothetical protein
VITITGQPAPATTVTAGAITGGLSVGASVTRGASLTYQWWAAADKAGTGGTPIEGATDASWPFPSDMAVGVYYYYCVVGADGAAPVRSSVAAVRVRDPLETDIGGNIDPWDPGGNGNGNAN